MILKLGMKHLGIELYKVNINHDPGISGRENLQTHIVSKNSVTQLPLRFLCLVYHTSSVSVIRQSWAGSDLSVIKLVIWWSIYKLCLETQAANLLLSAPMGKEEAVKRQNTRNIFKTKSLCTT